MPPGLERVTPRLGRVARGYGRSRQGAPSNGEIMREIKREASGEASGRACRTAMLTRSKGPAYHVAC